MKKIVIFNRKGGVGKTSIVANLAACLDVCKKKKILLVDGDAQSNLTALMTCDSDVTVQSTIADLFDDEGADPAIPVSFYQRNGKEIPTRMWLLPGGAAIDGVETDDQFVLKRYLEKKDKEFDFCIIDCPPALTEMSLNALCAADFLIVPVEPGRDSANGYAMVANEISAMKDTARNNGSDEYNVILLGALINKVNPRRSLDSYYSSDVWGSGGQVFTTTIRESTSVRNASEFGRPVHYFSRSSPVAADYEELAAELLKKIKKYSK